MVHSSERNPFPSSITERKLFTIPHRHVCPPSALLWPLLRFYSHHGASCWSDWNHYFRERPSFSGLRLSLTWTSESVKNAELMTRVILKTTCKRVLPERQEAVVTQIGSKLSQRNAARNRKGNGGGTDSRCLEKRDVKGKDCFHPFLTKAGNNCVQYRLKCIVYHHISSTHTHTHQKGSSFHWNIFSFTQPHPKLATWFVRTFLKTAFHHWGLFWNRFNFGSLIHCAQKKKMLTTMFSAHVVLPVGLHVKSAGDLFLLLNVEKQPNSTFTQFFGEPLYCSNTSH